MKRITTRSLAGTWASDDVGGMVMMVIFNGHVMVVTMVRPLIDSWWCCSMEGERGLALRSLHLQMPHPF